MPIGPRTEGGSAMGGGGVAGGGCWRFGYEFPFFLYGVFLVRKKRRSPAPSCRPRKTTSPCSSPVSYAEKATLARSPIERSKKRKKEDFISFRPRKGRRKRRTSCVSSSAEKKITLQSLPGPAPPTNQRGKPPPGDPPPKERKKTKKENPQGHSYLSPRSVVPVRREGSISFASYFFTASRRLEHSEKNLHLFRRRELPPRQPNMQPLAENLSYSPPLRESCRVPSAATTPKESTI